MKPGYLTAPMGEFNWSAQMDTYMYIYILDIHWNVGQDWETLHQHGFNGIHITNQLDVILIYINPIPCSYFSHPSEAMVNRWIHIFLGLQMASTNREMALTNLIGSTSGATPNIPTESTFPMEHSAFRDHFISEYTMNRSLHIIRYHL